MNLQDEESFKTDTLKKAGIDNYWRYEWVADIEDGKFGESITERKTPVPCCLEFDAKQLLKLKTFAKK